MHRMILPAAKFCGFLICLLLAGCSKPSPNTLIVGTVSGPESELLQTAQSLAKEKYGLHIKLVQFSDYNLLNEALNDGTLDANVFQHLPYLKAALKTHGYQLKVLGKTFIYPAAIYSHRYKTLQQLPKRALIALPNDPSNEARALRLLQTAGLITLKTQSSLATVKDVVNNPKDLQFKEMDAAQLPRVLDDVDAAVINTNYAIAAGLHPLKDGLFHENKHAPYANLIVVRQNPSKPERLNQFVRVLHSKELTEKAQTIFQGAAIPAWH